MLRLLGQLVSRHSLVMVTLWIALLGLVIAFAPHARDVTQDGEFAFLPTDSQSQLAEQLYRRAFPTGNAVGNADGDAAASDDAANDEAGTDESSDDAAQSDGGSVQQDPLGSNVVIILRRQDERDGLQAGDLEFIENVLKPKLEEFALQEMLVNPLAQPGEGGAQAPPQIKAVWTPADRNIGKLLLSEDDRAALVVVELGTEFLDRNNMPTIYAIEKMFREDAQFRKQIPLGLEVAISGSATVGRDMLFAEKESARNTERFTKTLVIVLLILIYRAPIMALIPLITVGFAVEMSLRLLRILAGWDVIGLFTGIDTYVTVVVYGAGVDFCLFLIARYKEELDQGATFEDAISAAVEKVGVALATSAGTSICGIGMMGFADFGKFRQAGFGISFGLFVVLCSALTFTPAMLRLCGRWAFWPEVRKEKIPARGGWLPAATSLSFLHSGAWLDRFWQKVADIVSAKPATIFLLTIALMLPFVGIAIAKSEHLSYGLLSDLPQDDPSVTGAKTVQQHYPAGVAGPTTVLLKNPGFNFQEVGDADTIAEKITDALTERSDELHIADLRTLTQPLGISTTAQEYVNSLRLAARANARVRAFKTYVSQQGETAGDVLRFDVVFEDDPFERDSINQLQEFEEALSQLMPGILQQAAELDADFAELDDAGNPIPPEYLDEPTELYFIGPTASISDLKLVTDADRIRINILVVLAVYAVLVLLLRRPAICAYLILSVLFSYLVTLGVTYVVFRLWDPQGFAGLDWKVPTFLFTILIAMGEDYNILLITRITEEQEKYGPVKGILVALTKTGSIISSCGIIMAGTFSSLMMGTLLGMTQLGFALAFGVLLDTFVVRPVLVPTYLILLNRGRFGRLGPLLGAIEHAESPDEQPTEAAPPEPATAK